MVYRLFRLLIMLLAGVGGFALYDTLTANRVSWPMEVQWAVLGLSVIIGALIGFAVAPWIIRKVIQATNVLETYLSKIPVQDVISGAVGIIIGLIIAALLGLSFSNIPFVGNYLPIVFSLILAYLGWTLGVKNKEEIFAVFSKISPGKDKEGSANSENLSSASDAGPFYKILDTSVIIDGRIADICKTGFLDGTLIIPGFVLEELRHIADSSDVLKRNRGRRGLDILNRIRKELDINVKILEEDFSDVEEVDSKLVKLARKLDAQIITNDFNLNKVAQLQGVNVLNINDLANAVKPVVLPGEEMTVQVIKEGKEAGQGVGYLDDGTMIVIESGKKLIGRTIEVVVTSVLQTSAGRMIFARPKGEEKKKSKHNSREQDEYQCMT